MDDIGFATCHEAVQLGNPAEPKGYTSIPPRGTRHQADNQDTNRLCVELELPHPDHYRPETVDFPSSPSGMMKYRIEDADASERAKASSSDSEEEFKAVVDINSVHLRKDESSDSENDDYFEDFHLPITHSTSMSTRRSFKRKLKALDSSVSELPKCTVDHNNSRRKLVPMPSDFTNESFDSERSETSPTKMTSTPNQTITDIDMGCESTIHPAAQTGIVDEMQLDERTVLKVRECLDSEKVKDIYTLGSRLQDLLTPAELVEVMSKQQDIDIQTSPKAANTSDLNSYVRRNADQKTHQTVKKRISILNEIARTDESDTGEDFSVDAYAVSNKAVSETQESAATISASLETPSDGWDISPESLPIAKETFIADRNGAAKPDLIPETSQGEKEEERLWRSVMISGLERKIDLKVIEPYKKVLSHGGYLSNDCQTAIIVFSACFLPDRGRADYDYVMENLFLYVLTTLDHLVAEDYVLIYFHGATPKSCIPRFSWVKNCYQMIDRRLRKNLKRLYLVHPTLWLKAAVLMCRPFISAKFTRKIVYIPNLPSLAAELPMDQVCIPDRVKQLEFTLMIQELKRRKGVR